MKSIEEKRDEKAKLVQEHFDKIGAATFDIFKYGWDACAKEYAAVLEDTKLKIEGDLRQEIADLKEELKIWELWHEGLEASIRDATREDLEHLFKVESAGE